MSGLEGWFAVYVGAPGDRPIAYCRFEQDANILKEHYSGLASQAKVKSPVCQVCGKPADAVYRNLKMNFCGDHDPCVLD